MRKLITYLLESVLAVILALLLIGAAETFIGVSVARTLLGPKATHEEVSALNQQLGLDRPFLSRTLSRIDNTLSGDLGQSYVFRQPVTPLLVSALKHSLWLILPALLLGGVMGVMLGIWVAYRPYGIRKYLLAAASSIALLPSLVLGTLTVYALGYKLNLITPSYPVAVILLALVPLFVIALTASEAYREAFNADFIRSLRSFGFPEWRVVWPYASKVTAVAIFANLANLALYLLTASVFIEITFSLPGLGSLLLTATERFDYPVILGISFAVVLFFGLTNFFSGILLYVLDPRAR